MIGLRSRYMKTLRDEFRNNMPVHGCNMPTKILFGRNCAYTNCLDGHKKILEAFEVKSVGEMTAGIEGLMKSVGLKTSLHELSIKRSEIDLIVEQGFTPARMNSSPFVLSGSELKEILLSIYD